MSARVTWRSGVLLASFLWSCGAPPAAKPSSKPGGALTAPTTSASGKPLITPLRTGALQPVVVNVPIAARVVDNCLAEQQHVLRIDLGTDWLKQLKKDESQGPQDSFWQGSDVAPIAVSAVAIEGSPAALGFVLLNDADDPTSRQMQSSVGPPLPRDTLWIRRDSTQAGKPLSAKLYVAAHDARPGYEFRVEIAQLTAPAACNASDLFARALRRHFQSQPQSAFHAFAIERLAQNFPVDRVGAPNDPKQPAPALEIDSLMGLASGYDSVEAALQRHNNLRTAVETKALTVPIDKLSKPRLVTHPWGQMLASLRTAPANEPLAKATPAEFYWLRARNVGAFYQLLDEIEAWLTPAYHLVQQKSEHRLLRQRYETELALQRSELGPAQHLVTELALVGSDPFLVMGSDMTLILRINSPAILKKAALDLSLAQLEEQHGRTAESRFTHEGVAVTLVQSGDLAIHRYSAELHGLTLISNSKAGISRVISAILGKIPSLADEPDFKYMLTRDAQVLDDILVYMGDRFIERSVEPSSRILDARRLFAQGELARPGHAALLWGWFKGLVPKNTDELTKSKLLLPSELRHFDGQPIQFEIAKAAHSSWGSVRVMTPLIDLPVPTKVSAVERDAYQRFVSQYERLWSEAIDPIALRISFDDKPGGPVISAKLRILPIVRNSDYRELQELVGDVRLIPGARSDGVRAVFGIAKDSELKRELGGVSRGLLGKDLGINWIGNYAMLGLADQPALANALARSRSAPSLPMQGQAQERDEISSLAELPLYAAIEVGSASATAIALAVVRKQLEGGTIQWQPETEYRGTKIQRVLLTDLEGASLCYALGRKTLFVSLSESVLERLLDDEREGRSPAAARVGSSQGEGQFVLDLAGSEKGGLLTSLSWLLENELRRGAFHARSRAEVLFRGDTMATNDTAYFRNLAFAYFGAIPVTPDGTLYQLTDRGVTDAVRGSAHAPVWPKLPVPGSEAARVLSGFSGLRTQLAFDREPSADPSNPQTSLAVSIELARRAPRPQ